MVCPWFALYHAEDLLACKTSWQKQKVGQLILSCHAWHVDMSFVPVTQNSWEMYAIDGALAALASVGSLNSASSPFLFLGSTQLQGWRKSNGYRLSVVDDFRRCSMVQLKSWDAVGTQVLGHTWTMLSYSGISWRHLENPWNASVDILSLGRPGLWFFSFRGPMLKSWSSSWRIVTPLWIFLNVFSPSLQPSSTYSTSKFGWSSQCIHVYPDSRQSEICALRWSFCRRHNICHLWRWGIEMVNASGDFCRVSFLLAPGGGAVRHEWSANTCNSREVGVNNLLLPFG